MSIAGRLRKARKLALASTLVAALAGIFIPHTAGFATTERIVVDPASGLAINGFDPVGYFTEGAAKFGRPDIEENHAGATWRFRNAGNRAAFVAHPDVYMPQFGGYDPIAVAKGKSVPGHPLHWVVRRQRLYLFYDVKSRAAFAADADHIVADAEHRWPKLRHALTP